MAKVGIGLVTAVGVGTAVVVAVSPAQDEPEQAVVTHHLDGDTFDVEVAGRPERIRLLNIDTPETQDPNRPAQCLGPEAAAFLATMIPVGTPVRLEFDRERRDRYGRTLAAAFTPAGAMVNAEIARAGLAQVVTVDENVRFRPPIEAAWREAASNGRGLHSTAVGCTVPGQVETAATTVAWAPTAASLPGDLGSAELRGAAVRAAAAVGTATTMVQTLDRLQNDLLWTALTPEAQARLRARAVAARDTATREEQAIRRAAAGAEAREAEAARAEADRVAAARAADEQRRSAQAAREAEAAQRAAPAEPPSDAGAAPSPPTKRRTGHSGHPCLPGERDGDNDGYCKEGR